MGREKKKKRNQRKKEYSSRWLYFLFKRFPFLVPQSRRDEKVFDVFLPTLFMHLVYTSASNHRTCSASLWYFTARKGLSLAVRSKDSTENQLEVTTQWAGMFGRLEDGTCLMDCCQTPEQKEANKSALLAPFCVGISK